MLSAPTPFTHDFRGDAIDRKRDIESKSKWNPKWATGSLTSVKLSSSGTEIPKRRCSQACKFRDRQNEEKLIRRQRIAAKQDVLGGTDSQEDSFTDDAASYAPTTRLEDNIAYSFDAEKGPSHGSETLSIALTNAVNKFDDHQTRKLVYDEYDVLDNISDAGNSSSLHEICDEDDGFELI